MNRHQVPNGEGFPSLSKSQTTEPYQPLIPSTQLLFRFSGPYSGEDRLPASRWLKKLQFNIKPYYHPRFPTYALEYINVS